MRQHVTVNDGMTDEKWAKKLAQCADVFIDGPVLKGLSRTKDYIGDRENEEREVARIALEHLGYSIRNFRTEPCGIGTIPDVEASLADGSSVAVEVTELADADIRRQRIKRRDEERRLGLTQVEAFRLELAGENPTPHHASRLVVVEWTVDRLRQDLERVIAAKDKKAEAHRQSGADFGRFAEMVLAIFTGEGVTADLIAAVRCNGPFRSYHFHRIVVVMDYDPHVQSYPTSIL